MPSSSYSKMCFVINYILFKINKPDSTQRTKIVVWPLWIETSGTWNGINAPLVSNWVAHMMSSYATRNSNGLSLKRLEKLFNTQTMTNPTIVSPVKMEYGWNFSISGLKMMVKSGLEKIFLKFLHALTIFY